MPEQERRAVGLGVTAARRRRLEARRRLAQLVAMRRTTQDLRPGRDSQ